MKTPPRSALTDSTAQALAAAAAAELPDVLPTLVLADRLDEIDRPNRAARCRVAARAFEAALGIPRSGTSWRRSRPLHCEFCRELLAVLIVWKAGQETDEGWDFAVHAARACWAVLLGVDPPDAAELAEVLECIHDLYPDGGPLVPWVIAHRLSTKWPRVPRYELVAEHFLGDMLDSRGRARSIVLDLADVVAAVGCDCQRGIRG